MRGKNIKYISVVVVLLVLAFGVGRPSAAGPSAPGGSLDSPGPPGSTTSYTLEDIYDRLDAGAAGSQTTFTEPTSGPTAGTGHTLNEIMALAPAEDNINAAAPAQVLTGKTYWGLRTDGTWGTQTGTMPNRGQVIYTPGTSNQTVAEGYHNGSGYVVGDGDLAAGNIKDGVNIFGVTGTYPWAPVPKTGQTTCHDASGTVIACGGTGQDGEYQKGVSWPSPRFTNNGNGTVTDNLTGLIWLQDASCPNGQRNWSDALTFANSLYDGWTGDGSGGDCGLTDGSSAGDWRLPNVRELQSLVDYGRAVPALPSGHPFTGAGSSEYWSSTSYAGSPSYAWFVWMGAGIVDANDKTNTYEVWPVRGGQ
jgi:hypothetical protein